MRLQQIAYAFLGQLNKYFVQNVASPDENEAPMGGNKGTMGNRIVTVHNYHPHRNNRSGFRIFSLAYDESESKNKSQGLVFFWVSVACCCGLCLPNMIITKANAGVSGEIYSPFHKESESQKNLQISIRNRFRADSNPGPILLQVAVTVCVTPRIFMLQIQHQVEFPENSVSSS